MCGIVGIIHRDSERPFDAHILDAMTDRMQLRGPDGRGTHIQAPVAFGHRRLSILDIDGAAQPMRGPEKDLLTFNGEIYNYVELRKQMGLPQDGTGDTATLLEVLRREGAAGISKLNGMFAFCYWNARKSQALLARDPVGQKPLLYYMNDELLIFGSQLTSIALHPQLPRELCQEGLAQYLAFESYPAPWTPLKNVRKLKHGHFLRLDQKQWSISIEQYWDPIEQASKIEVPATHEDRLQKLDHLIDGSIKRHMRSDVPVGIFLSAGYDSNLLVASAARRYGGESLRTYTIRNTISSFDESADAALTAQHFNTQHHERALSGDDFLAAVPQVCADLDEPLADPGLLAKSQVCAFASEDVKVVLSGDGGDEFFAGYSPFRALHVASLLKTLTPRSVLSGLAHFAKHLPASYEYMGFWFKLSQFLRGLPHPKAEILQRWIGSFDEREAQGLLRSGDKMHWLRSNGAPASLWEPLHQAYAQVSDRDIVTQTGHMFQSFFLPSCICGHADKASMRVSLELRAPMLDTELMAYANALPTSDKFHRGATKKILGDWLNQHGAPGVVGRMKRGFTVPLAIWFRGPLREWMAELLSEESLNHTGIFEAPAVSKLWNDHLNGRANHYKKLWTIAAFQSWHRGFFENQNLKLSGVHSGRA